MTKVVLILKAGSTQDVNNYRPISLLSIFIKIIAKLIQDYIRSQNSIKQYFHLNLDFRKLNQPCTIEIVEKIKYCIEEKKYGCGLFIDLKKAFDTVNHNHILLKELEHF